MTDTTPTATLTLIADADLVAAGDLPLDQNPAAVYLAHLKPGGRRTMRQALEVMAGLLLGEGANLFTCPWGALRFQHTTAIRAALVARYRPATANKMLSALRGVLKMAWRLGQLTAEEYARAADLPPVKGESLPAGRELGGGELAALLAVCADDATLAGARDGALLSLLYAAGLRREEVAALDQTDYDPDTGRLIIRGKGGKERTAYLVGGAAAALADWLAVRGAAPGPLFWPVNKGGNVTPRRMTPQAVYNALRKRAAEAHVPACSPHDLRRTFVGDLLSAGADIATVARMAGHANVQTTARYDRRPEEAKRRAAGLLHVPYHRREEGGAAAEGRAARSRTARSPRRAQNETPA
jgi:site-specific recombinase XerD